MRTFRGLLLSSADFEVGMEPSLATVRQELKHLEADHDVILVGDRLLKNRFGMSGFLVSSKRELHAT